MLLKEQIIGLQHIGIPVKNLEASIRFYEGLGFEVIHKKRILRAEGYIEVCFVQIRNLVL
jgi:catechol 2,3-dioxygenase-like lactoylglutathione lyase family enzyme